MRLAVITSLLMSRAVGMIFFDAASMPDNTETAPTGDFAGSGWQFQIVTTRVSGGSRFMGTIISPKHYVTAAHIGNGVAGTVDRQIVTQPSYVTGGAEKVYTIKNGGNPSTVQWWDPDDETLKNTDLRVFEIWETFPSYADLYSQVGDPDVLGSGGELIDFSEWGKELVMTGYGSGRGSAVMVLTETKGWRENASDKKARWGRNVVDGVIGSSRGPLLYFDFDGVAGQDECQLTGGDSGGACFIKDGDTWKLAGINYAVDTYEYGPPNPNSNGFRAAIYEGTGLYHGPSDTLITPGSAYQRSHSYVTRISGHEIALNAITQPAKATATLSPEGRLEAWAADFGVISDTAPGDDPDKDGLTNLEEYLTESDPNDFKTRSSPLVVATPSPGTRQFTLIETLDLVGRGITTTLQQSSDLAVWTTVTGTTEDSNLSDPVLGTRTRVLSRSFVGNDEVYFRLKVEL